MAKGSSMGNNKSADELDVFDPANNKSSWYKSLKKIILIVIIMIMVVTIVNINF